MTPYEELCKAFKIKRTEDESLDDFATRAVKKVNSASDTVWNSLSEELQTWNNSTQKAMEEGKALPELEGFPEETAEEPAEEEEAADEPGDDEATEEGDGEEAADDSEEEPAEESTEKTVDAEEDLAQEESTEEAEPEETVAKSSKPSKKAGKKPAPKVAKPKVAEPTSKPGKVKPMAPKTTTAPKAAVAKKATSPASTRNARTSIGDNDVIKVLAKENPYREGSIGFKAFKNYQDGMKVKAFAAKAKSLGTERAPNAILRFDIQKGYIKVVAAA